MTMYTTIEQRALTYYRADLNRIAPLTREEEADLVERLRFAHNHTLPPDIVTQAKQRLVEGMQRLVMYLALKQAPRFVRQDLEDLIQEASLALLEATERCAFVRESFSGYASYVIRRAFATAWTRDFPVSITRDVLLELAKHDGIRGNPLLSADSLDTPLAGQMISFWLTRWRRPRPCLRKPARTRRRPCWSRACSPGCRSANGWPYACAMGSMRPTGGNTASPRSGRDWG